MKHKIILLLVVLTSFNTFVLNSKNKVRLVLPNLCSQEVTNSQIANSEFALQLFPNPSNGFLNISYELKESINLSIINALGVEVINCNLPSSTYNHAVDLNSLNDGIYLVKIMNKDLIVFKKIVLRK